MLMVVLLEVVMIVVMIVVVVEVEVVIDHSDLWGMASGYGCVGSCRCG